MSRLTFISFIMLTGFFYVTGKPVDKTDLRIDGSTEVSSQNFVADETAQTVNAATIHEKEQKVFSPVLSPLQMQPIVSARNIMPALPSRNPKRQNSAPSEIVIATATAGTMLHKDIVAKADIEIVTPKKPVRNLTFAQVRNKSTSSTTKPLSVSYQQRYVKAKKPVLGPRLTAILLKRELRRVGCYTGAITSSWDDSAINAIEGFNLNSNNNLTIKTPTASALEQVQQTAKVVCVRKPSTGRTIIANATRPTKKVLAVKNVRQWKPKLLKSKRPVRKAALFTKPTTSPLFKFQNKSRSLNNSRKARKSVTRQAKFKRVRGKKRNYRAIVKRAKKQRYARRTVRRRTAVRSWKRTYRRKRFGFKRSGMEFSIGN
ncbi:MAG: hypothetical protein L3J67_12045 [Hyphomicrobiaceae bacterium]|nr:hypothetical protein [Hyphomicrobiaceae bacterium]